MADMAFFMSDFYDFVNDQISSKHTQKEDFFYDFYHEFLLISFNFF